MVAILCKCGKSYQVDDAHAGRTVRCRRCGELLSVPKRSTAVAGSTPPVVDQFATYAEARSASRREKPADDDHPFQNRGHYSLLRPVAQGGMGRISVARDEALKRDVALKELLDKAADSADSQLRFVAEAEITGQLEHPGIVPIYALGTDRDGRPFYAMRFVDGQTFKDAIDEYHKSPRPADLKALLRRFVMVCQTMAYAHNRGAIHRDLKPANIMLGRFGETLVMDWGLAKPIDDGKSEGSTVGLLAQQQLAGRPDLTGPDAVVGTPAYMPPEQAAGKVSQLGPAADIYSLGAVLYHLLTGSPPYSGSSSAEVLEKVKTSSPTKPSDICRDVPRALEAICLKAMARRPKARYDTAAELAASIEHWLDDEPVDAYQEPRLERLYRWSRKHKSGVVSGAIVLAAMLVVGSIATVLVQRERDKARVFERIAEDYSREAAGAEERAKEKEAEADRLAQEASEVRRQANDATQKGAEARQAADDAKKQIAEIETALAAKTGESDDLSQKLEAVRADLTAAEARAETESKRADAAIDRASELDRQVAVLRREADEYREITLRLTRLAELAANQRQPTAIEANNPWDDFAQRDPASFDVVADDNSAGVVVADTERLRTGRQSLHVTANHGGVCVTYPKSRNANWDLSKYDYLTFAFSLDDAGVRYRDNGLAVRIGSGSQSIEYRAKPEALSLAPRGWAFVKIPLWGNSAWVKRELNPLNLSRVDWIEVRVATWSPKLAFWLEDIKFGADPRHIDRELVPDPDRAAAEYVVATKGEADAWVSGNTVKIRTAADIPAQPFKIVAVSNFAPANNVTDAGLKLLGQLTDCRSISLVYSAVNDAGLECLQGMSGLEQLGLTWARAVNGSGLKRLASLPKLTYLGLNSTAISDDGMQFVAALHHLSELDLHNTQITDKGLEWLKGHPTLSSIVVSDTRVTEKGLRYLQSLPAGLEKLDVSTSTAPKGIMFLKEAPLRHLSVHAERTNGRIERSFLESVALFPDLFELALVGAEIDDDVIQRLSELQGLNSLWLNQNGVNKPNAGIANGALAKIRALPSLESFGISGPRISGKVIEELSVLVRLKVLSLNNVMAVEAASVIKLREALPSCKIIVDPQIEEAIGKLRGKK